MFKLLFLLFKNKKHRLVLLDKYLHSLYVSIAMVFVVILMGVVGYVLLEGYNLIEAFYMTVITLSTVGFTEVKPLTDMGRIFTSFLIIANLGIFAYAISTITSSILDGNLQRMLQEFKLQNQVDALNGHVILCGYGRYGSEVAKHFLLHKTPFVIIENAKPVVEKLEKESNLLFLSGDATNDELLETAGIKRAKSLITTLPDDAENIYVTLTARQLNPQLHIISRALNTKSEAKLKLAGANEVIVLEQMGGFFMATLVGKPDLVTFFQILSRETSDSVNLEEIDIKHLPNGATASTIKDLNIREQSGANVIGLKTTQGEYIVNPPPETPVIPGVHLFVLGNRTQIDKFKNLWSTLT